MRYDTPLQLFERWVLDEIEIDGTTIPRGAEVAMLFGSANHDPEVFQNPRGSTSPARTTPTSRSARASTTASERRWLVLNWRRP